MIDHPWLLQQRTRTYTQLSLFFNNETKEINAFYGSKMNLDSTKMFWASANDVGQLVSFSLKTSNLNLSKRTPTWIRHLRKE